MFVPFSWRWIQPTGHRTSPGGDNHPPLPGRRRQCAQVKPSRPQGGALGPLDAEEPLLQEPVITFTALKRRSACVEPQEGHSGFAPSEYSDMDIRTSKGDSQS